ncbi:MAG: redoxin domain-containing protein [Thermoflexales bacterium]|nr:redoxin domain-containing protein [Thermoflexales bacterium]
MYTQVLGISVDSAPCLKAWADSLGGISYPLLSDFFPHGKVAQDYGILREEGYTERAVFVIDKAGIVRYVDVHDIGEQPNNDELFCVLSELEPQAAVAQKVATPPAVPEPAAPIVMYCTAWCPDCRRARAYLKERGIDYVEVDITHDRAAARRVREWANGNETTPTFNIKGTIVVDFDRPKLDRALGIG